MSMASGPNDLTSRLRRRLETDRREIEETAARELERLGERLSAVASGALRSIERDTAEVTARMRAAATESLATAPGGRPEPFSRYQRRQLGDDALVVEEHRSPGRGPGEAEPTSRGGTLDAGRDRRDDLGRDAQGDRGRAVRGAAVRNAGTIRPGLGAIGLP